MAETKRQGGGSGKPAPAKGAPSQADLSKAIGGTIRVSTTLQSHTLEGTLFAADASLEIIAIREPQSTGSFHIIPMSQISNFRLLSTGSGSEEEPQFAAAKVDIEALKAREAKAIADAKNAEANVGKGVSKEAQELFDHMNRILRSRWNGQQIIVNETVIIEPPYQLENMKAPSRYQQALEQAKKIASGFWAKKRGASSGTATPVGNGAGGPPARVPVPNVVRKGG